QRTSISSSDIESVRPEAGRPSTEARSSRTICSRTAAIVADSRCSRWSSMRASGSRSVVHARDARDGPGGGSGVEDAQLERLADRLGAVHHIELAQDLLHVVLHRERADLEDGADLVVALAEVDPAEDLLLARGERVGRGGRLRPRPALVAAELRAQ